MFSPAATRRVTLEFDAFLFAQVGEDRSGMPLSVVSVLARLDLDPWQEAAQLASLSPESAAQKLALILGPLPSPSLKSSDVLSLATRLVAMLPRPTASRSPSVDDLRVAAGTNFARSHASGILLAIYLIVMVTTQLLMTHFLSADAPSRPATAPSSASSPISPAPSK